MRNSKNKQILEYIRDNHPVKAKEICEALNFERREYSSDGRKAFYYVGWNGRRAFLTRWSDWSDKSKKAILLTNDGYVLTKYGRKLLEE